jgi:hypothetical protein
MSRRAWIRDEKAREAEANGPVDETTTPLV